MSNELERWATGGGGLVSNREDRQHKRALNGLIRDTQYAGLRIDAEAALAGRIMERAVDLDSYRRTLANGDLVLDAVLTRIEIGYVDKAERVQRSFGSEFPL